MGLGLLNGHLLVGLLSGGGRVYRRSVYEHEQILHMMEDIWLTTLILSLPCFMSIPWRRHEEKEAREPSGQERRAAPERPRELPRSWEHG